MLNRSITLLHATALVAGIIIGASIFVQPSVITGAVPSVAGTYGVWLAAGLLTLCGALIAAELASAYPQAGGVYVFLREAFSPGVAFLWGWAMFWTMHTGIIAAIATVFARYFTFFIPTSDLGTRAIGVGAVVALTGVNYIGVRYGSWVQTTFTILKVGAIVGIIAIAFSLGGHAPPIVDTSPGDAAAGLRHYPAAVVAGLFAFGGWHMVTYSAEETVNADRTIPKALIIGVILVTACYIALNAAYFHLLSPGQIGRSTRVAADAADAALGRGGAAVMSVVVCISTFGALNGVILAGPRAYLAMARDGIIGTWAAAIHPRFRTPHRAIALQGVWAAVLVATGSYRALFTRVVYTEWIFFALMAAGAMLLRTRHNYHPTYRVRGGPLVPLLFIVSAMYIVIDQIVTNPAESATGLLLVVAGWPVYFFWLRHRRFSSAAKRHAD